MEEKLKLLKLDHIGIRVMDFDTSIDFYRQFSFQVTREDYHEHVVVLKHPSGIEINLLDSGNNNLGGKNILMDVDDRYPGYTHFAIAVQSIDDTMKFLENLSIPVTEGPVRFGDGKTSVFIRDPDRNVIEFTQLPESV